MQATVKFLILLVVSMTAATPFSDTRSKAQKEADYARYREEHPEADITHVTKSEKKLHLGDDIFQGENQSEENLKPAADLSQDETQSGERLELTSEEKAVIKKVVQAVVHGVEHFIQELGSLELSTEERLSLRSAQDKILQLVVNLLPETVQVEHEHVHRKYDFRPHSSEEVESEVAA